MEVSADFISTVTDSVLEAVVEWQNRPWRYRMGERLLFAKISHNPAALDLNATTGAQSNCSYSCKTNTSARSQSNASIHTRADHSRIYIHTKQTTTSRALRQFGNRSLLAFAWNTLPRDIGRSEKNMEREIVRQIRFRKNRDASENMTNLESLKMQLPYAVEKYGESDPASLNLKQSGLSEQGPQILQFQAGFRKTSGSKQRRL